MIDAENRKLLNIMYHEGTYWIQEGQADRVWKRRPEFLIDKQCWLVLKFLPHGRTEIKLNDLIRFGRVTFKVTELVITKEEIKSAEKALDQLKSGIFQI